MATQLAAVPEYVVETAVMQNSITGRVTQAMRYWLLSLADRVNTTPNRIASATASTASVAMTGNTTATTGTLSVLVRVDQNSSITYATTYASSGGTSMQYRLDVTCEQIL